MDLCSKFRSLIMICVCVYKSETRLCPEVESMLDRSLGQCLQQFNFTRRTCTANITWGAWMKALWAKWNFVSKYWMWISVNLCLPQSWTMQQYAGQNVYECVWNKPYMFHTFLSSAQNNSSVYRKCWTKCLILVLWCHILCHIPLFKCSDFCLISVLIFFFLKWIKSGENWVWESHFPCNLQSKHTWWKTVN